jgi:hypothetical protein
MTRTPSIPTVGGQSARLLLDTIRSFPLRVTANRVDVVDTASEPGRSAIDQAFPHVLHDIVRSPSTCADAKEHAQLDPDLWRWLVLVEMVRRCKAVLRDRHFDAIWDLTRWHGRFSARDA